MHIPPPPAAFTDCCPGPATRRRFLPICRPLPAWTYRSRHDPNLAALRKSLDLDSIAGYGSDVTRVLHLMHWMHDLITHDGGRPNPATKNAMNRITVCRRDHPTLNCRGLAIALNECYLAIACRSRYVTCLPKDSLGRDQDCHVIDMVFIPGLHKWIWVDPTFDATAPRPPKRCCPRRPRLLIFDVFRIRVVTCGPFAKTATSP